jgi:hypothetical protein
MRWVGHVAGMKEKRKIEKRNECKESQKERGQ